MLRTAANAGNAEAQKDLGRFYELGKGGLAMDLSEAAWMYCLAADQGNCEAQLLLGRFYELGRVRISTNI